MLWTILKDEFRFLTFRHMSPAVRDHGGAYLAFGLFFTWLAGIGRYWDNPHAYLWQQLGLGSVAYVFVLAAILWLLIMPLRPENWSFRNVLLFITLTAPPAILYAIPVEQFMSLEAAQTANVWFLAVVAFWRVALYSVFLHRDAHLPAGAALIATVLPLVLIVLALMVLNLEHAVFELMAGIGETQPPTANDSAYAVVFWLSVLSLYSVLPLLFGYIIVIIARWFPPRIREGHRSGSVPPGDENAPKDD